mgnify:FL=1
MNAVAESASVAFRRKGGTLRTQEIIGAGIHPRALYAMRDSGAVETLGRGIYRLASLPPMSEPDIAVVAKLVPSAVVCLISALALHELTTQIPHAVQIALLPGRHAPRISHPPLEVFRFSPKAYAAGVEERVVDGVKARVFSAEKTLADVFKFRNRIGLETAVEALRNYAARKRRRFDLVQDYARVCRVEQVMRPYLEALS